MKPMAEAISDYIIKHGVPESLRDIPNLPYRLEGCERKEEYLQVKNGRWDKSNQEEAVIFDIEEKCRFLNNIILTLDVTIDQKSKFNDSSIRIGMWNKKTQTVSHLYLKKENRKYSIDDVLKFDSGKTSGICNPMRQ
jgi:hypothetical protein